MLHLQAGRPTAGIVLGTAKPFQTALAVAGRPTPDRAWMHSKLLRHLLPTGPSGQGENRTAGVPEIRIGRPSRRFQQLALPGLGQLEQTRSSHTSDCVAKPYYEQYLV